jgi:hypothetical protein
MSNQFRSATIVGKGVNTDRLADTTHKAIGKRASRTASLAGHVIADQAPGSSKWTLQVRPDARPFSSYDVRTAWR